MDLVGISADLVGQSGDLVGFEQYSDVYEAQIQAIGNSFYFRVELVVFGGSSIS